MQVFTPTPPSAKRHCHLIPWWQLLFISLRQRARGSRRKHAVHIASMATAPATKAAPCTRYVIAKPAAPTEPPELDYRYFTPEFLDELEEHYQTLAVSQLSA